MEFFYFYYVGIKTAGREIGFSGSDDCVLKNKTFLLILLIIFAFSGNASWGLNAPGTILFHQKGKIYSIKPDETDRKVIAEKGSGPALASPDGKKIIYKLNNQIFLITDSDQKGKLIYRGNDDEVIILLSWLGSDRFFFKKVPPIPKGGIKKIQQEKAHTYFIINVDTNTMKKLGEFYEDPDFSPDAQYWVYSTYQPGKDKSEVYGGEIGEKGRYVFDGRMKDVLAWDRKTGSVVYTFKDKIYSYRIHPRERQIYNLPFKDVVVVSFSSPSLIFYYENQEENRKGLILFDPEVQEQKTLIDKKVVAREVTHNPERDKFIIFVPDRHDDFMGEGKLYLVEAKKGEATELTRDVGRRIFKRYNMSNQWSPDGKYFAYEKLRLKYSNFKKSEIFIAGEGKNEKLIRDMKFFRQPALPTWADFNQEKKTRNR